MNTAGSGSLLLQIAESLRLGFSFQCELRSQETMGLRHRGFRAIQNVGDELRAIRQIVLAAIEIVNSFLVYQE